MLYKLHPAIKKHKLFGRKFDAKQLCGIFLFIAMVVLFVFALLRTGNLLGPLFWWWNLLKTIWLRGGSFSSFYMCMICSLTALLIFFLLSSVYDFFTSGSWEEVPLDKDGSFTGIDFQTADVILQRKKPVILPYDRTALRLVIYLQKNAFQYNVTEKVFLLVLHFTHKKDIYTCSNFCDMEGIFPVLNYAKRFALFSYEFNDPFQKDRKVVPQRSHGSVRLFQDNPSSLQDVQYYARLLKENPADNDSLAFLQNQHVNQFHNRADENTPLRDYRLFIEEQIQNYLRYGVYVPYSPRVMKISRKVFISLSIILPFVAGFFLCLVRLDSALKEPFTLRCLGLVLLLSFIWGWMGLRFLRYFGIKKKLKGFQK